MSDPEAERYINWVRTGLSRTKGKTQIGLARHLGIAHPQITQALKGERQFKVTEIPRIAEYLEMPPPGRSYPIVGDVGAGGEISASSATAEPDTVEGPDNLPFGAVAVRIIGNSLGPGLNGWLAFYADRRDPFSEEWLTKLCVVGTDDDRVLIKWVYKGFRGLNLQSGIGELEEDVTVLWAARVIHLQAAP